MCERGAYQERARKTRTLGVADRIDGREIDPRLGQRLLNQRQHPAYVIARGELGNHPPVAFVQLRLTVQCVRKQPLPARVEGDPGFVAGCFDSEDAKVLAGRGHGG